MVGPKWNTNANGSGFGYLYIKNKEDRTRIVNCLNSKNLSINDQSIRFQIPSIALPSSQYDIAVKLNKTGKQIIEDEQMITFFKEYITENIDDIVEVEGQVEANSLIVRFGDYNSAMNYVESPRIPAESLE